MTIAKNVNYCPSQTGWGYSAIPPPPPTVLPPPAQQFVTDGEFHGWSVFRRLNNEYNGPLIRVRAYAGDTTGGEIRDIGFGVDGYISQEELVQFASSEKLAGRTGNLSVIVVYDQGLTNPINARTQSLGGSRPRDLVLNGMPLWDGMGGTFISASHGSGNGGGGVVNTGGGSNFNQAGDFPQNISNTHGSGRFIFNDIASDAEYFKTGYALGSDIDGFSWHILDEPLSVARNTLGKNAQYSLDTNRWNITSATSSTGVRYEDGTQGFSSTATVPYNTGVTGRTVDYTYIGNAKQYKVFSNGVYQTEIPPVVGGGTPISFPGHPFQRSSEFVLPVDGLFFEAWGLFNDTGGYGFGLSDTKIAEIQQEQYNALQGLVL